MASITPQARVQDLAGFTTLCLESTQLIVANGFEEKSNLSQYMKSFGESLIQQAAVTEEIPREPAPNPESQFDLPLAESLLAVFPNLQE